MHRLIRNHVEDALAAAKPAAESIASHLDGCDECRGELGAMQEHSRLMQEFKAPPDLEPRPGFYARVMERIEAEGAGSIWNLFIESAFGRRIAVASFALALLLGIYVVSAERAAAPTEPAQQAIVQTPDTPMVSNASALEGNGADAPGQILTQMDATSSEDDVLVNLVTYREQ